VVSAPLDNGRLAISRRDLDLKLVLKLWLEHHATPYRVLNVFQQDLNNVPVVFCRMMLIYDRVLTIANHTIDVALQTGHCAHCSIVEFISGDTNLLVLNAATARGGHGHIGTQSSNSGLEHHIGIGLSIFF